MWVVLRFVNEYDQFGGYFAGIYDSYEKALDQFGYFGRQDMEYEWFEICNITHNFYYKEDSNIHKMGSYYE